MLAQPRAAPRDPDGPITCLLADDYPIVTADPLLLSSALESGARGFLLKEAPVSDLARGVKMVANGAVYLDPALAGFLRSRPRAGGGNSRFCPRAREGS